METYSLDKAKGELSTLVEKALKGETIMIVQEGGKTVRVAPCSSTPSPTVRRQGGVWANQIHYAPDYDSSDAEVAKLILEGDLFPKDKPL